jgi:hypothetical protein
MLHTSSQPITPGCALQFLLPFAALAAFATAAALWVARQIPFKPVLAAFLSVCVFCVPSLAVTAIFTAAVLNTVFGQPISLSTIPYVSSFGLAATATAAIIAVAASLIGLRLSKGPTRAQSSLLYAGLILLAVAYALLIAGLVVAYTLWLTG